MLHIEKYVGICLKYHTYPQGESRLVHEKYCNAGHFSSGLSCMCGIYLSTAFLPQNIVI